MLYRGASASSRRFETPAAGISIPAAGTQIALGVTDEINDATSRRLWGSGVGTAAADMALTRSSAFLVNANVAASSGNSSINGTSATWTTSAYQFPWHYWGSTATEHIGRGATDEANNTHGPTRTGVPASPWAILHIGSAPTANLWVGGVCRVILANIALAADKIRAICLGHGATIDRYLKPSQILSDFKPVGMYDAGAMRVRNYAAGGPAVTRVGVADASPPYVGAQGASIGVTSGDQLSDNLGRGDIVPQHCGILGPYGSRTFVAKVKIVASASTVNTVIRGVAGKWTDGLSLTIRTDGAGTNGTVRIKDATGATILSVPGPAVPYVVGSEYYHFVTYNAETGGATYKVLLAGTTTEIYSATFGVVAAGTPRFAHPRMYGSISNSDLLQPAHFLLYAGALGDVLAFREAISTGAYTAYDASKIIEIRRPGDTTQASCFVKTGLDRASQTREWERQGTDGASANEAIVIRPNKYGARVFEYDQCEAA